MRALTLSEIVRPLEGTLSGEDRGFEAVATDSRRLRGGELFVALRGKNFDGHGFVTEVADRGACAAVISSRGHYPLPTLRVEDTLTALGRLGALNRRHFRGDLVAITGSSGKTCVKNMLASILEARGSTLATAGNLNNEIGVPATLLRLGPEHRYAVVEMGAAAAGDIEYLCSLARPDVSVLLNAMPAHLEGFGTVAGVARAKGEILAALDGTGTAVINADSEYAPLWRELSSGSAVLEFGLSETADVGASAVEPLAGGGLRFRLRLPRDTVEVGLRIPGEHNVRNALAAAAAATALGVDAETIVRGLRAIRPTAGRMRPHRIASGALVIDDSYNANPGSVRAAIDVLAGMGGRRILVLGAMAELGERSAPLHAAMGAEARQAGLEALWATGGDTAAAVASFGRGGQLFADRSELAEALRARLGPEDTVLVKGSRVAAMDEVVARLLDPAAEED